MDLARMKPLHKESVDLYTLVRDELSIITNTPDAKRITLSTQQKGNRVVQLAGTQITKVCMNLARNAIEAMVGNGIYDVQIDGSANHQIVAICRDSGASIPEKDVGHIFTPFYTTKEQGTGIGLYLVQHIAEDHAGTIRVTSRQIPTDDVPAGTTFFITLPRGSNSNT
jgi:polar amino acid transport system substrate-binding protein